MTTILFLSLLSPRSAERVRAGDAQADQAHGTGAQYLFAGWRKEGWQAGTKPGRHTAKQAHKPWQ